MCTGGDYPKGADMTEVQTSTKCLFYCAASALRSRWPKYKVMVPHAAECIICLFSGLTLSVIFSSPLFPFEITLLHEADEI